MLRDNYPQTNEHFKQNENLFLRIINCQHSYHNRLFEGLNIPKPMNTLNK